MTPSQVWKDRADECRRKAKAAAVAADVILDAPTDPADPWADGLRMELYRAELHRSDVFAQWAFTYETAHHNAVLDEMTQAERRARYDGQDVA